MTGKIILFLILNFGALALGGLFTGNGVSSEWYAGLEKAPWTPPGWVFGFAWTTIMLCFSFYMARLWMQASNKAMLSVRFSMQWLLNVSWNPVFFYFHQTGWAMLLLLLLTLLIAYMLFTYRTILKSTSLLLLPYFIWLLIACSLNAYILLNN